MIEMKKAKYYQFADIRKLNQGKGSSVYATLASSDL